MKKLLIFFFIFCFMHWKVAAQNLDSLWAIWQDKSQSDTTRLQAMQNFAWNGYLFTQPDSAFYFSQLQFELAKSKGLKKYMAGALNTQGTSFALRGDYPKALKYYFYCLKIKKELRDKQGIGGT